MIQNLSQLKKAFDLSLA